MRATLHNVPAVDNKDLFSITDRRQSMRNDHKSLSASESADRLLQFRFILGIDACCGLIQQHDWCIFEQSAGDRDSLPLATGKCCATLA